MDVVPAPNSNPLFSLLKPSWMIGQVKSAQSVKTPSIFVMFISRVFVGAVTLANHPLSWQ